MEVPLSSRDKILDVAEALFARRGFASVGLREVAEAVGLGKSSLFHHFRSKAQLYSEVMARILLRIEERLGEVFAAELPPEAKFERCIGVLIDALVEQPTTARLLLRSLFEEEEFAHDPPAEAEAAQQTLARIIQEIHRLLREGVAQGVFRDVSVPHTVQTLIGATVYHFASGEIGEQVMGGPVFSAEAVRRRKAEVIEFAMRGLAADRPKNR